MNRLHQSFISNPVGKAKNLFFKVTVGLVESDKLFRKLFSRR